MTNWNVPLPTPQLWNDLGDTPDAEDRYGAMFECTCTPIADEVCPACKEMLRILHGGNIPMFEDEL